MKSIITEIKRLHEAATKDWALNGIANPPEISVCDRECIVVTTVTNENSCDPKGQAGNNKTHLDLIAFYRNNTPALAEAYEKLEAHNAQLQKSYQSIQDTCTNKDKALTESRDACERIMEVAERMAEIIEDTLEGNKCWLSMREALSAFSALKSQP